VQDGLTGYLYDPDDLQTATAAVRRLLFDPAHRQRMSAQARYDAEQWGWPRATQQLERYYQDVLAREREMGPQIAARRGSGASVHAICEELQISAATFRRHARGSANQAAHK
jgi:DNA-binding NarL/FixJ family response regulator